jgi:hypothetical protein
MLGSSYAPKPEWWQVPATEALLHATATRLVATLGLCACRFEPFPFDALLPRVESGRVVIPADEPGVAPWSGDPGVELPVRHGDLTVGRFVLVPGTPTAGVAFSPSARDDAIAMVSGLGAVVAAAMLADGAAPITASDVGPPAVETRDPTHHE